jgi:glycosyltransferase involved in cell wall biosynthesis
MRILLATDAWEPQVNGVVRTLTRTIAECRALGHEVEVVSPDQFKTIPMPTYPEIRLALNAYEAIQERFKAFEPEAIHIATEGPIGLAARRICLEWKLPFTTSYHTRFPEYISARLPVPTAVGYAFMRWFHGPSGRIMVATESFRNELEKKGFRNLSPWSRGVDTELFRPRPHDDLPAEIRDLPRPIWLNVGRVAVEKNIEAFLKLELPGSKVLVGEGPQLSKLKEAYPQAHFLGMKKGAELAACYAAADAFVFPSRTDTFGLVLLEALACGTPVAAYPVTGPLDVVGQSDAGVLSEDLHAAALKALTLDREACRRHAQSFSWGESASQFAANLMPA